MSKKILTIAEWRKQRAPIGFKVPGVVANIEEDYEDFEDFEADEFEAEEFDAEDYEDFDDSESYEDMVRRKMPRGGLRKRKQKAQLFQGLSQINIRIANAGATDQPVELFNAIRSISKISNTGITSLTPFSAADRNAANLNGLIWWGNEGNLNFQNAAGGVTTISCREIPYKALLDSTMSSPFLVSKLRVAFSNDAQIDENFQFNMNSFMGRTKGDSINPRSFFDPKQNQNLIVDVKQSFRVDRETGLVYNVQAGQNIRATLYIPRARKAGMKV